LHEDATDKGEWCFGRKFFKGQAINQIRGQPFKILANRATEINFVGKWFSTIQIKQTRPARLPIMRTILLASWMPFVRKGLWLEPRTFLISLMMFYLTLGLEHGVRITTLPIT
jgi:hypothetical protein